MLLTSFDVAPSLTVLELGFLDDNSAQETDRGIVGNID